MTRWLCMCVAIAILAGCSNSTAEKSSTAEKKSADTSFDAYMKEKIARLKAAQTTGNQIKIDQALADLKAGLPKGKEVTAAAVVESVYGNKVVWTWKKVGPDLIEQGYVVLVQYTTEQGHTSEKLAAPIPPELAQQLDRGMEILISGTVAEVSWHDNVNVTLNSGAKITKKIKE